MIVIELLLGMAACYIIYTDIKYRIIPNVVTFPLIIGGIIWQTMVYGSILQGLLFSLTGAALGFLLFIFPYIKGWMGGGDLKYAVAIGSTFGATTLLNIIITATMAAALFALLLLLKKGVLWAKLKNMFLVLYWRTAGVQLSMVTDEKLTMPFGVFLSVMVIINVVNSL